MIHCKEGLDFAGRYNLERLLGRGGFSEVWLASDILTKVKVAVKIYAPGQGLDEEGVTSFSQEFALVFDMNHTNLLHPTHFDSWEGMPYLILPYCKNGSAFKFISEGKVMPEDECWKLLHDTAAGLAYLHEKEPQPIIHQDIKPDNILINDEGIYMITDFGISTKVRHTLHMKSAKEQSSGTMAYMGPERFGKDPTPIMASDIWSLGAMMFELMTNDTPFGNFGGGMQKNGADIPEIKGEYSQELKDIIYKCLEKETWDRPSAREIMEYAYNIIHGITVASVKEQAKDSVADPVKAEVAAEIVKEEVKKTEPKKPEEKKPEAKKENPKVEPKKEPEAKPEPKKPEPKKEVNTPNPPQADPVKQSLPLSQTNSKTKLYAIIAAVVVVVGGIVAFSMSGGDSNGSVTEETVTVNQDSINVEKIKAELSEINGDEINANAIEALQDGNNFESDSIESELLDVYQKYDNGIKTIEATSYASESEQFKAKRALIKERLGDICRYLESKKNALTEIGITEGETIDAYTKRFERISKIINQ